MSVECTSALIAGPISDLLGIGINIGPLAIRRRWRCRECDSPLLAALALAHRAPDRAPDGGWHYG
eukprot:scaffold6566_cov124-Isochrysis_galbana.AAC.3